jgi:hypothetical protein
MDALRRWCVARANLKIDERNTVFAAGVPLRPVASAGARAAQIDDRTHALACHGADVVRRRLRRAPSPRADPVLVEIEQAEDAVVDQQHIKPMRERPEQLARPRRRMFDEQGPPAQGRAAQPLQHRPTRNGLTVDQSSRRHRQPLPTRRGRSLPDACDSCAKVLLQAV